MESELRNKKVILITGATGFLGRHVTEAFNSIYDYQVIGLSSKDCDLTKYNETLSLFKRIKPNIVIHLAARLGGIGDNRVNSSKYFFENMSIGMNVLKSSSECKVDKVVNIGTVCSYPKFSPIPFREENLWLGFPEETNASYGIAKRALFEYTRSLKMDSGLLTVNLLLANLYGPGDDFRDETSHVIPAIMKKMLSKKNELIVWGDGSPTRDFLFVKDAALAILKIAISDAKIPDNIPPVFNVGTGEETSIKDLVIMLAKSCSFNGKIIYDTSKPNGQPKRLLDISKYENYFGPLILTPLEQGINTTLKYYVENKEKLDSLGYKFNK